MRSTRVLGALSHQTDRDFEIVVADDGSGPDTARVIENWTARGYGADQARMATSTRTFAAAKSATAGIRASSGTILHFPRWRLLGAHKFIATTEGSPNPDGSSPAIAFCCLASLTEDVLTGGWRRKPGNLRSSARERMRGQSTGLLPAMKTASRTIPQNPSPRLGWRKNLQLGGRARRSRSRRRFRHSVIADGG